MSESGDFLSQKALKFAIRIVKLYKWLCDEKNEFVMSKQLLRSGTILGQIWRKPKLSSVSQIL